MATTWRWFISKCGSLLPCHASTSEYDWSELNTKSNRLGKNSILTTSHKTLAVHLYANERLGIQIHSVAPSKDYAIAVEKVYPGSVAATWGVRPGAYIISVNDKSTRMMTLSGVEDLMENSPRPYIIRFMQPEIGVVLDRNPFLMTEFPVPDGNRLPGLGYFVEPDEEAESEVEHEEGNEANDSITSLPGKLFWMSDRSTKACYECESPFTLVRRRHHCRSCGQIFCSQCCARLQQSPEVKDTTTDVTLANLQKQLVCHTCAQQLKEGVEIAVSEEGAEPIQDDADKFSKAVNVNSVQSYPSLVLMPQRLVHAIENPPTSNIDTVNQPLRMRKGVSFSFDQMDPQSKAAVNTENENATAEEVSHDFSAENADKVKKPKLYSIFSSVQIVSTITCPPVKPRLNATILEPGKHPEIQSTHGVYGSSKRAKGNKNGEAWRQEPRGYRIGGRLIRAYSDPTIHESSLTSSTAAIPCSRSRVDLNNSQQVLVKGAAAEPLIERTKPSPNAIPAPVKTEELHAKAGISFDRDLSCKVGLDNESISAMDIPVLLKENKRIRKIMSRHAAEQLENVISHQVRFSPALSGLPFAVQAQWVDVIKKMAMRISKSICCRPEEGDSMDVMNYVKGKFFKGGTVAQCRYVDGVLCRKGLSRKNTKQQLLNPKILLIASSLEHQRQQDHILSLENVAGQEVEYMHIVVEKIMTLRPDIVLFGGHVHRVADELLYKHGIVVVKNADLSILQSISRSTGAALLASADHVDKIEKGKVLGECRLLRIKMLEEFEDERSSDASSSPSVSLMPPSTKTGSTRRHHWRRKLKQHLFFEGANPAKGCAICLCGGTRVVLQDVWRIIGIAARTGYNLRLQRSCLTQRFLVPPESCHPPKNSIDWFRSASTSLYLGLKSNSLTLRSALKEQQLFCDVCKTRLKASDVNVFRTSSGAGYRRDKIAEEECTCLNSSTQQTARLRDKLLFSMCWGDLDTKNASPAEMKSIQFYSSEDCTLGSFLDKYCFTTQDKDIRRAFRKGRLTFTHDVGRLVVTVINIDESHHQFADNLRPVVHLLRQTKDILMWTGSLDSTKLSSSYLEMHTDTYNYSFGKYLEDMFYGIDMRPNVDLFPHLRNCCGFVQYFSRNSLVARFRYEKLEPVLNVSLQPALWKDNYLEQATTQKLQQEADVRDLHNLLNEVYESTMKKISESLQDVVTSAYASVYLKRLKNELRHWTDRFHYQLDHEPPTEVFTKNYLIRDMYLNAEDWSNRISSCMHATVKLPAKVKENSPKGALPRDWFGDFNDQEASPKPSLASMFDAATPTDGPDSTDPMEIGRSLEHRISQKAESMQNLASFAKQIATRKYAGESPAMSPGRAMSNRSMRLTPSFDPTKPALTSPARSISQLSRVGSVSNMSDTLSSSSLTEEEKASKKLVEKLGYFQIPLRLLQMHPGLPLGIDDTVVLVNTEQPTSVVAYSLCSKEYAQSLNTFFTQNGLTAPDRLTSIEFGPRGTASDEAMVRMLLSARRTDVDTSFQDDNHFQVMTKFKCRSFYAMQFHALRRLYYGGDRKFVESLCNCEYWEAAGGKSGAGFMKTQDQRFIAKVIPAIELQMFLSLAQEYFKYMAKTFQANMSSMLSKILGVYEVVVSGDKESSEKLLNVLVMENLIYGRQVDHLFDLKGKMDGRFKHALQGEGVVLWDRNFVELTGGIPLPLKESAMALLVSAGVNDTKFLSSVQVTDYSMLIGYDRTKQEVIVCIIDYIHKYDLLKMVEHAGKRLIQEEREITVLNPRQYRKRFRKAMLKYFTAVPNRYTNAVSVRSTTEVPDSVANSGEAKIESTEGKPADLR